MPNFFYLSYKDDDSLSLGKVIFLKFQPFFLNGRRKTVLSGSSRVYLERGQKHIGVDERMNEAVHIRNTSRACGKSSQLIA